MFENVDGRTSEVGVTGILKAHLGAFGSGELIMAVVSFALLMFFSLSFRRQTSHLWHIVEIQLILPANMQTTWIQNRQTDLEPISLTF